MPKLKALISEKRIKIRVNQLARRIAKEKKMELHLICILKGAAIFYSDLVREISKENGPKIRTEFLKISSYKGKKSTGKIHFSIDFDIKGKSILIIEDIVDTGMTLNMLMKTLLHKGAKEVKICTLLDKPSRRKVNVDISYKGFVIPDKFVVGYGLDYNQEYRELPYIAEIK